MKNTTKKYKSIKRKTFSLLLLIGLVFLGISYIIVNRLAEGIASETEANKAFAVGDVLIDEINSKYRDEIIKMQKANKITNMQVYEDICARLNEIRNKNDYAYLYTLYLDQDGALRTGFNADHTEGPDDYFKFGDKFEYTNANPVLETKANYFIPEVEDDELYGPLLTSYAVSLDEKGNIELILATDNKTDTLQEISGSLINSIIKIEVFLIASILITCFVILSRMSKHLRIIGTYSQEVSDGDLTTESEGFDNDEVGVLYNKIHETINKLKDFISKFKFLSRKTKDSMENTQTMISEFDNNFNSIIDNVSIIDEQINELSYTSNEVADYTNKISTQFDEIAGASEIILENSLSVYELNNTGLTSINDLNDVIINTKSEIEETVIDKIIEIKTQMAETSQVVSQIEDISRQINLLALNASVEASRSGEAGRSFAVVAESIRDLSSKTDIISKKIIENMREINTEIDEACLNSENVQGSLDNQKDQVNKTIDTFENINKQLQGFLSTIDELNTNIDSLKEGKEVLVDAVKVIQNKIDSTHKETKEIEKSIYSTKEELNDVKNSLSEIQTDISQLDAEVCVFKTDK